MKIVFFGTPSFVTTILERLHTDYHVVAVVTAPDKKVGRKQLLTASPIKHCAMQLKIPAFTPEKLATFSHELASLHADLYVVAAYGKIIPQEILDLPAYGALNVHPSLLPKYRGPSPIQQTILNGDKTTGVTIIKMDAQMDHGPILAQEYDEVAAIDTFESLAIRLFEKSAPLLSEVIPNYIAQKITPKAQDDTKSTYTKIISKADGFIDLATPPSPAELDHMIRAYYPWPGVWSKIRIKNNELRIKFLPEGLIQIEGKNPMSAKDFLNGYPELPEKLRLLLS